MIFFDKLANFFRKSQSINVESGASEIFQAGRDIHINNYTNASPSLLCIQLIDEKACVIKNLIDEGKNELADIELWKIIESKDFYNLGSATKAEYYYLNGLVNLNKERFEFVSHQINKLNEIGEKLKAYQLLAMMGTSTGNVDVFEDAIKKLNDSGISEEHYDILLSVNYLACNKITLAISQLTDGNVIKPYLANNVDARLNLGLAFLQKSDFELAKKEFEITYGIKALPYVKYLIAVSTCFNIISKTESIFSLSSRQKKIISLALVDIENTQFYFSEQGLERTVEYWANRLNISLVVNPSNVLTTISGLSNTIQNNESIMLIRAECYFILNEFGRAQELYSLLYQQNKNEEYLIKLLASLYEDKKYLNVTELIKEELNNDIKAVLYINSFSKLHEYQDTKLLIEKLMEIFGKSPVFLEAVSLIAFLNDEINIAHEQIHNAINYADDNKITLLLLASSCAKMNLIKDAIDLLRKINSDRAKIFLIELLIEMAGTDELDEALILLNEIIANEPNEAYFYAKRALLSIKKEHFNDAFADYEKAFSIDHSEKLAFNAALTYLQSGNKNYTLLEKYIPVLQKSSEPIILSFCAELLHLSNYSGAKDTIYKALLWLGEKFEQSVYSQYFKILSPITTVENKAEIIEYENVQADCVTTLEDSKGNKIFICLESDITLIRHEGEMSFGCLHYSSRHLNYNLLLGRCINASVKLNQDEYKIINCINKFVFAYRYCIEKIETEKVDNIFLKSFRITDGDVITPLLPFIEKARARDEFILKQYNFTGGKMVPLLIMANGQIEQYVDGIIKILEMNNQPFFAGMPNLVLTEKSSLVLTLSSVVVLSLVKSLPLLRKVKNIYVPESLLSTVDEIIVKTNLINMSSPGGLGIDNNGRPIFHSYTEKEKQSRLEFWQNIRYEISNLIVEKNISNKIEKTIPCTLASDFDAISIAVDKKAILICDDICMRTYLDTFKGNSSTNSANLIQCYSDVGDKLDSINILSRMQYTFCCLEYNLLELCNLLEKQPVIIGEGSQLAKLQSIIQNLCQPMFLSSYITVFRNLIHRLLSSPIRTNVTEKIVLIIIGELRKAVIISKTLTEDELLLFLTEICGLDTPREIYIKHIFKISRQEIYLGE